MKYRLLAALLLLPSLAVGQACEQRDLIVANAKQILELRPQLPRFTQRHVGADAAYMLIQYEPLSTDEGIAIIDELRTARVRYTEDLALAHAITRIGPKAAFAQLGQTAAEAFANIDNGALRALILSDGGDLYLELLGGLRKGAQNGSHWASAVLITDQSDAFKQDLANRAEQAGILWLAGHLLSDISAEAPIQAFLQRNADDERMGLFHAMSPAYIGLGIAHGAASGHLQDHQIQMRDTLRAMTQAPHGSALSVYLNQTGRLQSALSAARALDAAIQSGAAKATDADATWLIMVDRLIEIDGAKAVAQTLGSFAPPSGRVFADEAFMSETTDRIRAVHALGPFVSGSSAELPSPPPMMTDFDWDMWADLALALANDGLPKEMVQPDRTRAAIALLRKTGRFDDATTLAQSLPLKERVLQHQRLMRDLDMNCARHSYFSHQSWIGAGRILYRFAQ